MNDNPYAIHDDNVAAAYAPVDARVAFLRKTYTLLLAGILTFAGTLFLAGVQGSPVYNMAMSMQGINPFLYAGIFIGGAILVHAMAEKPFGIVFFFLFAFLFGLLSAPLVLMASSISPDLVSTAALMTALMFTGLTAYVFKSGKDFAFLGGILMTLLFGMFGVAICGWLFGFSLGIWFSYLGVAIFSGYILYDTSNILKRYPTTAHVSAAMVLFVDVILLFKHILIILMSSRD